MKVLSPYSLAQIKRHHTACANGHMTTARACKREGYPAEVVTYYVRQARSAAWKARHCPTTER